MSDLEKAIAVACDAHKGQVDKSGQPYILHPLTLMMKFKHEDERIVSVLHDVVEDSDVTLHDLRQLGFAEDIVAAIDCLTKREGESYDAFLARLSVNQLAQKVKVEDIKNNLDVTRLNVLTETDLSRIVKYHKALQYLLSC